MASLNRTRVRKIATEAMCDERTVRRFFAGESIRELRKEAIINALHALGWLALLEHLPRVAAA